MSLIRGTCICFYRALDTFDSDYSLFEANHDNSLISVSINNISGHIVTLTRTCLYLYTVNGHPLSRMTISHNTPMRNSEFSMMTSATIGIAIPTADWQEGVEAVTGHESGLVCLWKLRRIAKNRRQQANDNLKHNMWSPAAKYKEGVHGEAENFQNKASPGGGIQNTDSSEAKISYIHRELYVCSTISKVHEERITALRLCQSASHGIGGGTASSAHASSSVLSAGGSSGLRASKHNQRNVISALPITEYAGGNNDLLIGDANGCVSRWTSHRLLAEK